VVVRRGLGMRGMSLTRTCSPNGGVWGGVRWLLWDGGGGGDDE
jgi:hypothetical protein